MRRSALPILLACLVAVGGAADARADQLTNGSQPAGAVVGAKRGRDRGNSPAAAAATAAAAPATKAGRPPLIHDGEQPASVPLQARAVGACVASVSVICFADGRAVAGWPAPAGG